VGRGKPERGPITGPPGSGKSTFVLALKKIAEKRRKLLVIQAKDCRHEVIKFQIPEQEIVKRISSILQFTAYDGFRPAFDILSTFNCDKLVCLIETAEKVLKSDVAIWITSRIKLLLHKFFDGTNVIIPTCLNDGDELVKRLVIGILYAVRQFVSLPVVIDDALGFVVNESYREAFIAMMRPFIVSINRYLDSRDLLQFNPVIITPGGAAGFYRLARPDSYTIIFDSHRWELKRKDVEKIAYS
jgi:hypothetical protein